MELATVVTRTGSAGFTIGYILIVVGLVLLVALIVTWVVRITRRQKRSLALLEKQAGPEASD